MSHHNDTPPTIREATFLYENLITATVLPPDFQAWVDSYILTASFLRIIASETRQAVTIREAEIVRECRDAGLPEWDEENEWQGEEMSEENKALMRRGGENTLFLEDVLYVRGANVRIGRMRGALEALKREREEGEEEEEEEEEDGEEEKS